MCVHVRGCVGACRRACVRVSVCFYIYMLYIEIYIYSINFQVIAALLTRVYALISFLFKNFFQKENYPWYSTNINNGSVSFIIDVYLSIK